MINHDVQRIAIGTISAIFIAMVSGILLVAQAHALLGSNVRILDVQNQWTDGFIFTIHYVVSGHIKNVGLLPSGQIQLRIVFSTDSGAILWTTTVTPTPESLGPGETGFFSLQYSTDDLGGYRSGIVHYVVQVISE